MDEVIRVEHLKKVYGKRPAINDITFSVKQGEIFGLLGPSGAGKTTLIKILTGQLKKTSGRVHVLGFQPEQFHHPNFKAQIGVLTDNSTLYERLSVYDNLKLFCKIYHIPLKNIDETLEKVNLLPERKKTVSKLSKGMKQRVLLARALLHRPILLFLDEPTSSLDPRNTVQIHQVLKEINKSGTTIFLTTHDMEEATKLCQRVILLDRGQIKEMDSPEALRYKYSSNQIIVETHDGRRLVFHNHPESGDKIKELIENRLVKRIETEFPTLGEVFLRVTGRELQ